jgi:hypothetical protein
MVGPYPCAPYDLALWRYPAGGNPFKLRSFTPPIAPYGLVVSLAP